MAQNRGGLSSVDEIEEEVEEEQAANEPGLGVMVGSGKSAMLASPSTLDAMAELYNQRMSKQNSFMEAMKDAAAWTGGGIQGPTETLKMRDEQRSKQASELFSMQNQIAQHRQAMKMADAFLGTTQPTAAAQGETATDQAAPAAGGRAGGLIDMVKDPNLKRQIGAQYLSDPKAAMGQLNKYLMETGQTGELAKFENMLIKLGVDPQTIRESLYIKGVGPGAVTPYNIRGAQGTEQQTPLQAAAGVIPRATGPVSQAPRGVSPGTPAAAAIRNPAPPQAAAPQPGAAPGAAPAPAPRAAPAPGAAAPAPAPAAQATPATMAPSYGIPGGTGFKPGTEEDLDARLDYRKNLNKKVGAQSEGQGKELATDEALIKTAGVKSGDRLAAIQNITNIVGGNPKAVGPLAKPGVTPAVLTVIRDGISAGNLGQVGVPGIEAAVRNIGGSQTDINAAIELDREFAALQLANSQSFLKGQGAVSDAERRLIALMSGKSGDSPEAILRYMQWQRKRAEFDADIYKDYINEKRKGTPFENFIISPKHQAKMQKYSQDLLDLANQPLASAPKPSGAKKSLESHPGRALLDKYPKR